VRAGSYSLRSLSGLSDGAPNDSVTIDSPLSAEEPEQWNLRHYVAGQSPKSLRAFANLMRICEEHLDPRYDVEIVDLLENPQLGAGDEIVAIPTLVRRLPAPMRKIIGDLPDSDRVLVGLQLRPRH
jgi:circadian clock protein KaiB